MSFSPQRPRVGNAPAPGPRSQADIMQPGSVAAARERAMAMIGNRPQQNKSTRSVQPASPKSPKRPWDVSTSPNSRQRTYEQDYYDQQESPGSAWPLPASRYNPPGRNPPPIRKDRNSNSTTSPRYAETFYDGASDVASPQSLHPPLPVYGRNRDSGTSGAPAPSVARGASWASSNSGEIPDFPLPTSQYQTGRRSQNNPPATKPRRGQSSYYSQLSGPWGVSPIPEESNPRTTTNSYASSNVIPSQMKEFYIEETPSDDDKSTIEFDWARDGDRVQQQSPGLVRQASLGRRTRPALTTIKSENLRAPAAMPAMPLQVPGANDTRVSQVASILDGESVFLDASSSEHTKARPNSDISFIDPFNRGALGRINSIKRAEKLGSAESKQTSGLAARAGARRPPNINVQAVREAEARASLTSLPDLIRRATRLAANLDRGKTASRLGMDWMTADEKPFKHRQSEVSSLGGMLASFPPPATARGQTPSDRSRRYDLYKGGSRNGTRESSRRKRQICGMSRRAFAAVFVVVLILVAAAVILPVFLIALPNRDKNLGGSSVPVSAALVECQRTTPCANGGTSVVNLDQTCGCICTNGFTGPQCNTESRASCTTVQIAGASASVGSQIPTLVQAAREQYMIPLDAALLSSAFAANAMTCTTENALVTFPGVSSARRRMARHVNGFEPKLALRTEGIITDSATPSAGAPSSAGTATATLTSSPNPESTGILTQPSSPPSSPAGSSNLPATSSTATQFAQVGILFVLQDSRDINMAISAQENISRFFQSAARAGTPVQSNNVTLDNGYLINLADYIITLRNGTRYGIGVNFNGTPTGFSDNNKRGLSALQLLKRVFLVREADHL